jgi:hypothetical protein
MEGGRRRRRRRSICCRSSFKKIDRVESRRTEERKKVEDNGHDSDIHRQQVPDDRLIQHTVESKTHPTYLQRILPCLVLSQLVTPL